jgi:predicted ferric reductase
MIAASGWLLLLAAPYSKMTRRLIGGMVLPVILGFLYISVLFIVFQTVPFEDYSFLGLVEVLADPWVAVLGWTHLLVFDLVVVIWMKQDAQKYKIRHRMMVIPYLLTFVLGPVGLLAYLLIRGKKTTKKSN